MYVLYLDIFFMHNIVLIGMVSCFMFQLLRIPIWENGIKILLGSALGAGLEVVLLLSANSYGVFAIGSQIIVMPLVLWTLLRKYNYISPGRYICLSYIIVILFIGASNAISNLLGNHIVMQIGGLGTGVIVESMVLELKKIRREQRHQFHIEVGVQEWNVRSLALYDSGNTLCESKYGRIIHIASEQLIHQLHLEKPAMMVPYQSLGNGGGILEVYKVDWLVVISDEKKYRYTNVLLGKAQDTLLKNKQYQMILNEAVFETVK